MKNLVLLAVLMVMGGLKAQTTNLKDKPNVLLIIADDLNTNIGPYMGIKDHTPNLDKLADSGVRFTRTYCQYPLCGPSRASFMSGLYPKTNGIMGNADGLGSYRKSNPKLANHPSMAGFFREQGYYTARVSKIFHMGVPGGIERGDAGADDPDSWDYAYNVMGPETLSAGKLELLSPYDPHLGSSFSGMVLPDALDYTQTDYLAANQAIAILQNRAVKPVKNATNLQKIKKDAPFFLAVGLVRPHVPFVAPQRFYNKNKTSEINIPEVNNQKVPEAALEHSNEEYFKMNSLQKKKVIAGYMSSIEFMDEQVGRLLSTLDRLDLRKNTIVVFVSDHGFNLGEHDAWSKTSLWEGTVRIPLIFSIPGKDFKEKENDNITELIDLYPTLADLCGFEKEKPQILQGQNLFEKNKTKTAYTITHLGKDATIRTDEWRYTRWGAKAVDDKEELYHHKKDPEELNNLAQNPKFAKKLKELRKLFDDKQQQIN